MICDKCHSDPHVEGCEMSEPVLRDRVALLETKLDRLRSEIDDPKTGWRALWQDEQRARIEAESTLAEVNLRHNNLVDEIAADERRLEAENKRLLDRLQTVESAYRRAFSEKMRLGQLLYDKTGIDPVTLGDEGVNDNTTAVEGQEP